MESVTMMSDIKSSAANFARVTISVLVIIIDFNYFPKSFFNCKDSLYFLSTIPKATLVLKSYPFIRENNLVNFVFIDNNLTVQLVLKIISINSLFLIMIASSNSYLTTFRGNTLSFYIVLQLFLIWQPNLETCLRDLPQRPKRWVNSFFSLYFPDKGLHFLCKHCPNSTENLTKALRSETILIPHLWCLDR